MLLVDEHTHTSESSELTPTHATQKFILTENSYTPCFQNCLNPDIKRMMVKSIDGEEKVQTAAAVETCLTTL